MKIISGGQTGVDRAALNVAVEVGLDWGGWCPKGGWAEDLIEPPGLLPRYPRLRETPQSNPLQRTEWNVRDSDATLIVVDGQGLRASIGTQRAYEWARKHGKPEHIADADDPSAYAAVIAWLREQQQRFGKNMTLNIGGPRESEVPGIHEKAKGLISKVLDFAR